MGYSDNYIERAIKRKNEVLSTLAIMGYSDNYIERAIKIHNKSWRGTDYNLSLLVEIIDRLKQKDAKKGGYNKLLPFSAHFQSVNALIQYLRNNNTIDFRFDNGRYILCKILEKDLQYEHKILLHPASQPLHMTKHNKYCYIYQDYTKLAIEKSVTLRKITNKNHPLYGVSIDDYIDVNPLFKEGHGGWKHGQIIKMDPNSAQVKVLYFLNNENHSFWIHLENNKEAAKFNSKYDPLNDHIPQHFNEFHDVHPLKRFTSIDVIDNNYYNNVAKQKSINNNEDTINQLMNFGFDRKQIVNAMTIAKNKTDINEIVECIERQEQNNKNNNNNNNNNNSSFHKIQISEMPTDINNSIEIDYNIIIDVYKDDENNKKKK